MKHYLFNFIIYIFSNAFDCRMAVAIVRLPNGLDFSDLTPDYTSVHMDTNGLTANSSFSNFNSLTVSNDDLSLKPSKLMHCDSNMNLEGMMTHSNTNSYTLPQPRKHKRSLLMSNVNT